MLEPRQEKILLALISEYIGSAEPVGSALLSQKYNFDCSPATIRAEMARLEDLGYLFHPHTSAGRIPCDKAYRFYVDRLMSKSIAPPEEAQAIARELADPVTQLEALIEQTSRTLSQMTRYTSVVLGPRLGRCLFKYLQLVSVGPGKLLLVMMTHAGSVVHRVVDVSMDVPPEDLTRLTNLLTDRLSGLTVDSIDSDLLEALPFEVDAQLIARVGEATRELARQSREKVFLEGTAHLLHQPEFRDVEKARQLLEVLEQEQLVAEILEKSLGAGGLGVVIGSENSLTQMHDCTMVTATYHLEGVMLGAIGVVGPTRLPYERVMSVVRCVADNFTRCLTASR